MKLTSKALALLARRSVVEMTHRAKAAHTGSSLSMIDILAVLYTSDEGRNGRYTFISKGHAAAGAYAVLAHAGFFPVTKLSEYCSNGSSLGGHVTQFDNPGVNLSTGSLGHALSFAVGVAYANQLDQINDKVFVILSDGECDEGSNWEAALLAAHHKLQNLTVIIDRNRLQSFHDTERTVALEPLDQKWSSFGWHVINVDGHDHDQLLNAVHENSEQSKPKVVIARTVKGKGISFMENDNKWHYKPPSEADLKNAISELS